MSRDTARVVSRQQIRWMRRQHLHPSEQRQRDQQIAGQRRGWHSQADKQRQRRRSADSRQDEGEAALTSWRAETEKERKRGHQAMNRTNKGQHPQAGKQRGGEVNRQQTE